MLRGFGQSIQHMSQHQATMLQDVALKCCERSARPKILNLSPFFSEILACFYGILNIGV